VFISGESDPRLPQDAALPIQENRKGKLMAGARMEADVQLFDQLLGLGDQFFKRDARVSVEHRIAAAN
jgi:hypothetical protein